MKTNTLENGELKAINTRKCILLTSKSALVSAQNPLTKAIYNTLSNSDYGSCSLPCRVHGFNATRICPYNITHKLQKKLKYALYL